MRKGLKVIIIVAVLLSFSTAWTGVEAASSICPMCGGTGRRSVTIYVNQTIGWNSVTGMPTVIQVPRTDSFPCTTCGSTGRIYTPGGSSTSSSSSGSSSSSNTSSGSSSSNSTGIGKKVVNGTVIDASDGIGDYEDAPNLLDGKTSTKFNVKTTSMYIIWKAPKKTRVSSYTITTANDTSIYKGRNPKSWILYGSNKKLSRNSKGWKKIHSVKNAKKLKAVDFTPYKFKLKKKSKAYRYFKLEITANKGADCTQLAEFTLNGAS